MASENEIEVPIEESFGRCINQDFRKWTGPQAEYNVVHVQLHGIARFACWWFVIWSVVGGLVALPVLMGSHW